MSKKTPDTAAQQIHDDVDKLASGGATPIQVVFGQYSFDIKPLKTKQLFPFLKLIRPLFAALSKAPGAARASLPLAKPTPGQGGTTGGAPAAAEALPDHVQSALSDGQWMISVMEDHGPNVVAAMACALDTTCNPESQRQLQEQINDLDLVDTIVLAKHLVEVNTAFFMAQGLSLAPLAAVRPAAPAGS